MAISAVLPSSEDLEVHGLMHGLRYLHFSLYANVHMQVLSDITMSVMS